MSRVLSPAVALLVLGALWATATDADHRGVAAEACPVTIPEPRSAAPGDPPVPGLYGDRYLRTSLPRDGRMAVKNDYPYPPGSMPGYVHRDGSISVKFLWGTDESIGRQLVVRGRLGGTSRPHVLFRGRRSRDRPYWPSRVRFSSAGCWRVTAHARGARLSFVIAVSAFEPTGPEARASLR